MTWVGPGVAVAMIVAGLGGSGCTLLTPEPPPPPANECFFDDDCSDDDVCIDFVCRAPAPVLPCGVEVVPAGWRCVDDTLICDAPVADQGCDVTDVLVDGELCGDVTVHCLQACAGDEVGARCLEDAPGVDRRWTCPAGSIDGLDCACASKCDCPVGDVCVATGCVPAPATCAGNDDCPRGPVTPTDQCQAFQCNGFTNQCFDPDPASRPCTQDGQCVGRPGCAADTDCTCTDGACIPN